MTNWEAMEQYLKDVRPTNPTLHHYLVMTMRRSSQNPNNSMAMAAAMYMGRQQYGNGTQHSSRELRQDGVLHRIRCLINLAPKFLKGRTHAKPKDCPTATDQSAG